MKEEETKYVLLQIENSKVLEELSNEAVQVAMNGTRLTINKFHLDTEATDLLGTGLVFNEKCHVVTQIQRQPHPSLGLSKVSNHSFDIPVPPGTYSPGTILYVNGLEVVVERYIAEGGFNESNLGGFAHVYIVWISSISARLVLKRISCADQTSLNDLLSEAKRKLSGHDSIVRFYDCCYGPLRNGVGFELLILMEYCQGGHLVDYLNSRLENRLGEPEIWSIFSQICQGVAYMHSFNPPIVHRDLKIENVLLNNGVFKLCDFGSCTIVKTEPNTFLSIQELRRLEDEIGKFTTLQYRAPEMCDLYQKKGLNEKVDIWALGVLLYKLCYYTTPFEEGGKMAIMNGNYVIPPFPPYSNNIKDLIRAMLEPNIELRLDIYQVYWRVCNIRNVPYNLDIKPKDSLPTSVQTSTVPSSGTSIPFRKVARSSVSNSDDSDRFSNNITPMRRGRPQKGESSTNNLDLIQDTGNSVDVLGTNSTLSAQNTSPGQNVPHRISVSSTPSIALNFPSELAWGNLLSTTESKPAADLFKQTFPDPFESMASSAQIELNWPTEPPPKPPRNRNKNKSPLA